MTGTPGNAGALLDYMREGPAAPSVCTPTPAGIADEFGKLASTAAQRRPAVGR